MRSILLVLFISFLVGCTHQPYIVIVHPPVVLPACDTSNVSYARDIQPVIMSNCYSCHGDSVTAGGGLNLEVYSSFKSYLAYGFKGDGIFGSKFYHCVLHSQGAQQMPPTYMLDTCVLKKVKAWIDRGAPEN